MHVIQRAYSAAVPRCIKCGSVYSSSLYSVLCFHSLQVVPELNTSEVREVRYLHLVTELNETTHNPDKFLIDHEEYVDPLLSSPIM